MSCFFFFFKAEDGIRGAQESRGLGDVYKRQRHSSLGNRERLLSLKKQEKKKKKKKKVEKKKKQALAL